MAFRKSTAADRPAAIPTDDGHAIIGGRPTTPEFYEAINRQASGLPPTGARKVSVTAEVSAGEPLPSLAVARQVVGREIGRLRGNAEDLERRISAHPAAFQGNANPYLASVVQAHNAMTAGYRLQLAEVQAELAELEALDGQAVQVWAAEYLKTHPGPVR
jgi:hypothetical protein